MNESELLKALGPLAPLYQDPAVLEIMVDAPDRVSVERRGAEGQGIADTAVRFASPDALRATIDAILALGGVTLGPDNTIGEMRLPDARLLAVIPPTALGGPYLVVRKLNVMTLTWDQLVEFGSITREALDLLQGAIRARVSMLIAGGAGSGKTTVANMLAGLVPPEERIVVVEGAHELQIKHPRVVQLEAGGPAHVAFADLVATASCMRPDWLIVGELLGSEAMQVVQIMGRGHTGMTTLHATSTEDALSRLEAMCLMANLGLGLNDIRIHIAAAFQLIAHQERMQDGRRRITQITELRGVENDRFILQPLMRYNPATGKLEATGAKPGWAS